ncbi:MAG: purine phosphorylase, partial [Pseudomonadota bacterium]
MPAGIVVALPAEARTLSRVSQPGDAVRLGEHSLLIVSGMGARRAGKAARALLHAGATALVSWGTAGGLDPKYRSGHLLVSEKILTTSGEHYLADQAWRTRVLQTLSDHIDCSDGNVVTTGQVLTSAADRRRLHAQSGAAAVD